MSSVYYISKAPVIPRSVVSPSVSSFTGDQFPPPLANFSYPPDKTELQFNSLDSFVTSWVTPILSQDPCFLSIYYWNDSGTEQWKSKYNQTVSLNGTKLVSLALIDSSGLGQLNFDYVDPLGGHKRIVGTIFHINHDPAQSKAMTWNQDAPFSSATTSSSAQTISMSMSSASTTSAPPSSPSPSPSAAKTLIPSPTSTATQSSSLSSHGAEISTIALGTLLGLVLAAVLLTFWLQRNRRKKLAEQDIPVPSAAPVLAYDTRREAQEKGGEEMLNELDGTGKWELNAEEVRRCFHLSK